MSNEEQLLDFLNKTSPEKLKVEEDLGFGFVRLNVTEAQARQAKDDIRSVEDALVELLRNSRDAKADKILIASWRKENLRNIVVIDNGEGIPENLQQKIFEPRVTSKLNNLILDNYGVHGRGMALFSIAANCLVAKVIFSKPKTGTVIKIIADTNILPEKANQSTWPIFNSKNQITEGPQNLIRHSVEFNIQHNEIEMYLGTNAEILNKLLSLNLLKINSANAEKMHDNANEVGLDVSFRNCQRVLYGEINILPTVLKQAKIKLRSGSPLKKPAIPLTRQELEEILLSTKKAVNKKTADYYLKVGGEASITKAGNELKITLPLESED